MFKYAIALTGGIATGKSSVANLLKLYGFKIIDADEISHKILDNNIQEIKTIFGEKYIIKNKVDRQMLGNLIFNNECSAYLLIIPKFIKAILYSSK